MGKQIETALQQIPHHAVEIANASDTELDTNLTDAENLKLFATGIIIVGLAMLGSAVGIHEAEKNEVVKQAALAPYALGSSITTLGAVMFIKARSISQAVIDQAQQRGLSIHPGLNRSLELPQD